MTDIVDPMAEHGDALDAEAERETLDHGRIITDFFKNIRVHTAGAEDLKLLLQAGVTTPRALVRDPDWQTYRGDPALSFLPSTALELVVAVPRSLSYVGSEVTVRADLVGVSLALGPNDACYIPLGHVHEGEGGLQLDAPADLTQIPMDAAIARLKPLLEDPSVLKVAQNAKYDMAVLARYGSAASGVTPAAESPAPLPASTSRRSSPSSRRAVTSSPLAPPPR
jgi:hypothetical protein